MTEEFSIRLGEMCHEILSTKLVYLDYVVHLFSGGIVSAVEAFRLYDQDKSRDNGTDPAVCGLVDENRSLILEEKRKRRRET